MRMWMVLAVLCGLVVSPVQHLIAQTVYVWDVQGREHGAAVHSAPRGM